MSMSSFILCLFGLQRFLFQLLHIAIDAVQLFGNVNALRTVGHALAAADAVAGLAQARYTAVVPDEEGPACLTVVGMLLRSG